MTTYEIVAYAAIAAISVTLVVGYALKGRPPTGHLAAADCATFELRPTYKVPWVRCVEDGGWASLAPNHDGSLAGRTITLEITNE